MNIDEFVFIVNDYRNVGRYIAIAINRTVGLARAALPQPVTSTDYILPLFSILFIIIKLLKYGIKLNPLFYYSGAELILYWENLIRDQPVKLL